MRLSKIQKTFAFTIFTLTILLFQNFTLTRNLEVYFRVPVINEDTRLSHAKELLGKKYSKSFAFQATHIKNLNLSIYNEVENNLPQSFRSDSLNLTETIIEESIKNNLDPVFVVALIKTESSFNPLTKGSFGEIGLMQIKPDTAKWIAKKYKLKWKGARSLYNPMTNVKLGITYLSHLRNTFDNFANKYLSAYNMGPTNVRKLYRNMKKPKDYSMRVMKNYKDTYAKFVSYNLASNTELAEYKFN